MRPESPSGQRPGLHWGTARGPGAPGCRARALGLALQCQLLPRSPPLPSGAVFRASRPSRPSAQLNWVSILSSHCRQTACYCRTPRPSPQGLLVGRITPNHNRTVARKLVCLHAERPAADPHIGNLRTSGRSQDIQSPSRSRGRGFEQEVRGPGQAGLGGGALEEDDKGP